jgi:hypothetical protein
VAILRDLLTNDRYGAGISSAELDLDGTWAEAETYCADNDLLISPVLGARQRLIEHVEHLLSYFDGILIYSQGVYKLKVRRADPAAVALSDADYVGEMPAWGRIPQRETRNRLRVEWTDRADNYVRAVAEATDDWSIADTGERGETIALPGWTVGTRAMRWAHRALWSRGLQPIIATLRTGPRHTLLEPGDVVTVTHSEVDLRDVRMRVRAISEAPDRTYTVDLVEEPDTILSWPATVAVQSTAMTDPSSGRTTVTDDTIVVPFEVPAEIPTPWQALIPVLGVAVTGASSRWIGANIYLSRDGTTYTQVHHVRGGRSIGALTSALPEAPMGGLYDDARGDATVDFGLSLGSASTQTREGMLALTQLAVVGGEWVSWQGATLVGSYTYRLRGMLRGVYDTTPASHAAQTLLAVIGPPSALASGVGLRGLAVIPLRLEDVGRTLYLKCPAVTVGFVQQDIASVQAIPVAVEGVTVQPDPPSGVQLYGDGLAVTDQRTLTISWRYRWQRNVEDLELRSGVVMGRAPDFSRYEVALALAPSSAGPWTVATMVAITSEQLVWHTASAGYVRADVAIRDAQGDLSPVRRRVFRVI